MKKILSVTLCVALVLSVLGTAAFAAEDGFKAFIATDIHYSELDSVPGSDDDFYAVHSTLGLQTALSPQIFDEFLSAAAASDVDYVFLTGDLTDKSDWQTAVHLSEKLSAFAEATGKQVFVINGNHDTVNSGEASKSQVDVATFKGVYAKFGYSQALAVDENTCSYTAELKNGYRLIAIDSCLRPGDGSGELSAELLSWIDAQVKQAKSDGVKLVALMHHGLMEHFKLQATVAPQYVIHNSEEVCAKFSEWGIKFVFTGHFHANDVAIYRGKTNVYDVETTSLSCYPCAYRSVDFSGKEVVIETKNITSIATDALPEGYTEAQTAAIESDFTGYTYGCTAHGVKNLASSYISADRIISLMKLDPESDEASAIRELVPAMIADLDLPLYGEEGSVEAIAAGMGYELSESDFATTWDVIAYLAAAHFAGDEDYGSDSAVIQLLFECVLAVFGNNSQALSSTVKDSLTGGFFRALGSDKLADIMTYSNIMSKIRIVSPFEALTDSLVDYALSGITVDAEPADNNVTLPGYDNTADDGVFMRFIHKFLDFFRMILNYLKKLFGAV
ncbi:MAG: metallophosphoesterase [Clostridia bacterium]|nr:metallophosphoesterase [Clostridia bacterium]